MAELADAHGSGPCESNFMQVQVLLPAPKTARFYRAVLLYIYKNGAKIAKSARFFLADARRMPYASWLFLTKFIRKLC